MNQQQQPQQPPQQSTHSQPLQPQQISSAMRWAASLPQFSGQLLSWPGGNGPHIRLPFDMVTPAPPRLPQPTTTVGQTTIKPDFTSKMVLPKMMPPAASNASQRLTQLPTQTQSTTQQQPQQRLQASQQPLQAPQQAAPSSSTHFNSDTAKEADDPTVCTLCDLKFPSTRSLAAHRRWKHSNNPPKAVKGKPDRGQKRDADDLDYEESIARGTPPTTTAAENRVSRESSPKEENLKDVLDEQRVRFEQREERLRTELRAVAQCARQRVFRAYRSRAHNADPPPQPDFAALHHNNSQQHDDLCTNQQQPRDLKPQELVVLIPSLHETLVNILISSACKTAVCNARNEAAQTIQQLELQNHSLELRIHQLQQELDHESGNSSAQMQPMSLQ